MLDCVPLQSKCVCTMNATQTTVNIGENKMKNLGFKIKIETKRQHRHEVAEAIQKIVGGKIEHIYFPVCYDPWHVIDRHGRTWKIVAEPSMRILQYLQAKIVSPTLTYDDIPELKRVIQAVRELGVESDGSCGIHIAVDAQEFDARAIKNLFKMVAKREHVIEYALGTTQWRLHRFCKRVEKRFFRDGLGNAVNNLDDLNTAWYGQYNSKPSMEDDTRNRGLNLNNFWYDKTVEYRWFNGTVDDDKIVAYLHFALAFTAKALSLNTNIPLGRHLYDVKLRTCKNLTEEIKSDFSGFLNTLGLKGKEFKTTRAHLLEELNNPSVNPRDRNLPERG